MTNNVRTLKFPIKVNGHEVVTLPYLKFNGIDISPIPHYHKETCSEISEAIKKNKNHVLKSFPSTRLAFKTQENKKKIPDKMSVTVAGLLDLTYQYEYNLKLILKAFDSKKGIIKLKLSNEDWPTQVVRLKKLVKETFFTFRLDFHGVLEQEKLDEVIQIIGKERIEYLEDPAKDTTQLAFIKKRYQLPLACDQMIPQINENEKSYYDYLCFKPSSGLDLDELDFKLPIIISSAYSYGMSFFYEIYLAHKYSPKLVHGLFPIFFFKDWPKELSWRDNKLTYKRF